MQYTMTSKRDSKNVLRSSRKSWQSGNGTSAIFKYLIICLTLFRRKMAGWISHCSESRYLKCGSMATRLRDEGNIKFQMKDDQGSLKLYTESVICAPEYGPELSLAFGNRSAALYHQGKIKECLEDIALALKYRFPKETEYKLHQRKGQCLVRLGRTKEALQAMEMALKTLANANKLPKNKRISLERDIKAVIMDLNSPRKRSFSGSREVEEERLLPEPVFGISGHFKSASSALEIRKNDEKGRYVVTNKDIQIGDVLFCEAPYASVLLPEHYSTHCHECHNEFVVPIPCLKCTQTRYCSDQCREISWNKYHQYECSNLDLLQSVGIAHLAERIVVVTGVDKLRSLRGFVKGNKLTYNNSEAKDSYADVLNLVEHFDRLQPEDLFQYAVTATLITMLLEQRTSFFGNAKNESKFAFLSLNGKARQSSDEEDDFHSFVSAVILKHIVQLICNASAIYEVPGANSEEDNSEGSRVYSQGQVRIATAIYPSASMMNHSCDPTVINSFINNHIIVRAIKDVKSGEEIFNCYGPHFRRQKRNERQEALKMQYNFHCSCIRCLDDEMDLEFDRFSGLLCRFCGGPIGLPADDDETDNKHELPCLDCHKVQAYTKQIEEAFTSNQYYEAGLQCYRAMDFRGAIEKLKQCLELRKRCMYVHNDDVAVVEDKLAECLAMTGSYEQSAKFLRNSLESVKKK